MPFSLLVLLLAGNQRSSQTIVIEGFRPPSDAMVSAAAMKYLPFQVPPDCTGIRVHKEFEDSKNTVDFGLFDPRGYGPGGPGFRGWQGGIPEDAVVTGSVDTTGTWFLAGPIQPGEWNIAQYFLKSSPAWLKYRYTVTLDFAGSKPPARMAPIPRYRPGTLDARAGWYPGNLHCHSLHSDGGNSFVDLARLNAEAGFKFMVSTEHNNTASAYRFPEAARSAPGLLLIEGDEFTSPFGHAGILGSRPGRWFDFRFDGGSGRLPGVIQEAHKEDALFVVNHPAAPCTSCAWRYPDSEWAKADGIEVWNGAWDISDQIAVNLWERRLRNGDRINAYGGTDYHRGKDPLTPATFVYAKSLSRNEVLRGLRIGATSLSEGANGPLIDATLDGARPGSQVRAKALASLDLAVIGREGSTVLVRTDDGVVRQKALNGGSEKLHFDLETDKRHFVRIELRKGGEHGPMLAMTNAFFIRNRRS